MEHEDQITRAYTIVFDNLAHLGPGDSATTRSLVERLRPDLPTEPRVADFGCGAGASALVLAQALPKAHVLALDSHAAFIARLESTANQRGLGERIIAVVGDMAEPPPLENVMGEFDLIWSESSIYSVGRTKAFARWRPLLNPGGWLVFSDVVWQAGSAARSDKVSAFWLKEYPDITTADAVLDELVSAGFDPLRPVFPGRRCWTNYYEPLRERLQVLSGQAHHSQALIGLLAELEREIGVFDCTRDEVALAFFPARREVT